MAIAERLSRYKDFATFLVKYGRAEFVSAADSEPLRSRSRDEADADEFARDVESLGPTFIKLGQLLSTRGELLPPTYTAALARLQDAVEPFSYAEAVEIVERELHVRLSKAFVAFEETPIAAASLGQVHRAVLRSGREVAVKIQRPQVREQVLQDLDTLDDLAVLMERFSSVARSL